MPLLSATLQQPVMRRAVVRRALTNSQNHWLSNLPRPARVAGAAAALLGETANVARVDLLSGCRLQLVHTFGHHTLLLL